MRLNTEKPSSIKCSKVKYDFNAVKALIEFESVNVTHTSCCATTRYLASRISSALLANSTRNLNFQACQLCYDLAILWPAYIPFFVDIQASCRRQLHICSCRKHDSFQSDQVCLSSPPASTFTHLTDTIGDAEFPSTALLGRLTLL